MWESIQNHGELGEITMHWIRSFRIYSGTSDIWMDPMQTQIITQDNHPVTVSIFSREKLSSGKVPEEGFLLRYLKDSGPSYPQREINATKRASILGLPVFVVRYSNYRPRMFQIKLANVDGWDERLGWFYIRFLDDFPWRLPWAINDRLYETEFSHTERRIHSGCPQVHFGKQRFRFEVFKRYGPQCAVCGVDDPELLDAVHIIPESVNGTDDPHNGIVLCTLHHRAFDLGHFKIHPYSLEIVMIKRLRKRSQLSITNQDITHLPLRPHVEALKWQWNNWRHQLDDELQVST